MDDLDFDFTAEHPKADMSKVAVIKVNGKGFVAVDKVLELLDETKFVRASALTYAWNDNVETVKEKIKAVVERER